VRFLEAEGKGDFVSPDLSRRLGENTKYHLVALVQVRSASSHAELVSPATVFKLDY
jgi:hypothetical protein